MELTKEMMAYIDGFGDGYSRGYQDAIVATESKATVRVEWGNAQQVGHERDGANSMASSSSGINPLDTSVGG